MEARMTYKWDREADILYLYKVPPYADQESQELGNDVIARLNPATCDIEGLEVLFFSSRQNLELPVSADLRPVKAG